MRARLAVHGPFVPLIVFAKGANHAIQFLAYEGSYDVFGLDWGITPPAAQSQITNGLAFRHTDNTQLTDNWTLRLDARKRIKSSLKRRSGGYENGEVEANGSFALQGNIDPSVLYAGHTAIEEEVKRVCAEFRGRPWIANLGHGITPGVDPDDLKFFFECVHKYSTRKVVDKTKV